MTKLTIIAKIIAVEGLPDVVKQKAIKMVAPTRQEEGCIEYRLQQDNETPENFLMIEQWQSRELWQVHMQAEHLKAFAAATEGKVAEVVISAMTEVA